MATDVSLELWRGAARSLVFTVYTSTGAKQDVSGWAVSWDVRVSNDSPGTFVALSTATSGVTLSDPTNGQITVTLTAAQATIPVGSYRHTLARTDTGSESVLANGSLRVKGNTVLPV